MTVAAPASGVHFSYSHWSTLQLYDQFLAVLQDEQAAIDALCFLSEAPPAAALAESNEDSPYQSDSPQQSGSGGSEISGEFSPEASLLELSRRGSMLPAGSLAPDHSSAGDDTLHRPTKRHRSRRSSLYDNNSNAGARGAMHPLAMDSSIVREALQTGKTHRSGPLHNGVPHNSSDTHGKRLPSPHKKDTSRAGVSTNGSDVLHKPLPLLRNEAHTSRLDPPTGVVPMLPPFPPAAAPPGLSDVEAWGGMGGMSFPWMSALPPFSKLASGELPPLGLGNRLYMNHNAVNSGVNATPPGTSPSPFTAQVPTQPAPAQLPAIAHNAVTSELGGAGGNVLPRPCRGSYFHVYIANLIKEQEERKHALAAVAAAAAAAMVNDSAFQGLAADADSSTTLLTPAPQSSMLLHKSFPAALRPKALQHVARHEQQVGVSAPAPAATLAPFASIPAALSSTSAGVQQSTQWPTSIPQLTAPPSIGVPGYGVPGGLQPPVPVSLMPPSVVLGASAVAQSAPPAAGVPTHGPSISSPQIYPGIPLAPPATGLPQLPPGLPPQLSSLLFMNGGAGIPPGFPPPHPGQGLANHPHMGPPGFLPLQLAMQSALSMPMGLTPKQLGGLPPELAAQATGAMERLKRVYQGAQPNELPEQLCRFQQEAFAREACGHLPLGFPPLMPPPVSVGAPPVPPPLVFEEFLKALPPDFLKNMGAAMDKPHGLDVMRHGAMIIEAIAAGQQDRALPPAGKMSVTTGMLTSDRVASLGMERELAAVAAVAGGSGEDRVGSRIAVQR